MHTMRIVGTLGVISFEGHDILLYDDYSHSTPEGLSDSGVEKLKLRVSAIKLQDLCRELNVNVPYINSELKRTHKTKPFSPTPIAYWEKAVLEGIEPIKVLDFIFGLLR